MNTCYKCCNAHLNVVSVAETEVVPLIMDCQHQSCREIATLQQDCPQDAKATHLWYRPDKRRGITKEDNRRYRKQGLYLKQIN